MQKRERIWLVLVVFAGALPALAQSPTATLVGRVTDTSGGVISGAALQLRNLETNQVRVLQTGADGEFTIPDLSPAGYQLVAEKPGFQRLISGGIRLQVNQVARLDLVLQVGSTTESIEVTAQVPLLNTENASRGDVISLSEIEAMPLEGRDFQDLAALIPGVAPKAQGGTGADLVFNGARSDATNFTIDGFSGHDPATGGRMANPPLDAIQEFKVQVSGYSAEYGRLSGGAMVMALKSGGNRFHGSLFEYLRNDRLDARSFFDPGKNKLRRNQFGASLDGPVRIPKLYEGRDRTFFVVTWEGYRERTGNTGMTMVPTALERQGDFSQTVDPQTGRMILLKDPLASGNCTAASQAGCFPGTASRRAGSTRSPPGCLPIFLSLTGPTRSTITSRRLVIPVAGTSFS